MSSSCRALSPTLLPFSMRSSYPTGLAGGKPICGRLSWWGGGRRRERTDPHLPLGQWGGSSGIRNGVALKPGGHFITATHVGDEDAVRTEAYGGVPVGWTTHNWRPEQLVDLIEQAGLRPSRRTPAPRSSAERAGSGRHGQANRLRIRRRKRRRCSCGLDQQPVTRLPRQQSTILIRTETIVCTTDVARVGCTPHHN